MMKVVPINGRWFVKLHDGHIPTGPGFDTHGEAREVFDEIIELRHAERDRDEFEVESDKDLLALLESGFSLKEACVEMCYEPEEFSS